MATNHFRPRKYEDFEIADRHNEIVGHIRVTHDRLYWAPKWAKLWYGVSLTKFAELMEGCGEKEVPIRGELTELSEEFDHR